MPQTSDGRRGAGFEGPRNLLNHYLKVLVQVENF